MFWIIVLIVVAVIVVIKVLVGKKEAREIKEWKERQEQEAANKLAGFIKELEDKAASGDADASINIEQIKERINLPLIEGDTNYDSAHFGDASYSPLRFRAAIGQPGLDSVYNTAGNIAMKRIGDLLTIRGNYDFVIDHESDDTKNPKEGSMTCYFTAPTGETCTVRWAYSQGVYFDTSSNSHGACNSISVNVHLKMEARTVGTLVNDIKRDLIDYIKSQGGIQLYHSSERAQAIRMKREFWD